MSFLRELLVEAIEDGVTLDLSLDEARRARWHGAKSTITSIMRHLELGDRAVRFSGNWKSVADSMPDRYLRESQLLVLRAQEEALKYIRAGGDLGVLEGIALDERPEGTARAAVDDARHEAYKAEARAMSVPGLVPTDVAPEFSSREASLGAMAAPGDVESEKGDVVGLEDFEGKLNERRPAEDESDSDLSTGETTDSEAGMYLTQSLVWDYRQEPGEDPGR